MQYAKPTILARRKSDGFEARINQERFDPDLWEAAEKDAKKKKALEAEAVAERDRVLGEQVDQAAEAEAIEKLAAAKKRTVKGAGE